MSEPRITESGSANRLMAWAEDFDIGRFGSPHYANPGEVKRDVLEVVVALREMIGSYEALASMAEHKHDVTKEQVMKWDGPTCARRALGHN